MPQQPILMLFGVNAISQAPSSDEVASAKEQQNTQQFYLGYEITHANMSKFLSSVHNSNEIGGIHDVTLEFDTYRDGRK